MSLIIPYGATETTLTAIISALLNGATLHAYVSNHTPATGDTASTYNAIEATFGGYAAITLGTWAAVTLDASNRATTSELVRTWTTTGTSLPQSVYGIYVLSSGGDLLYAELDPTGPIVLSAAGQTASYQPVYTFRSQF